MKARRPSGEGRRLTCWGAHGPAPGEGRHAEILRGCRHDRCVAACCSGSRPGSSRCPPTPRHESSCSSDTRDNGCSVKRMLRGLLAGPRYAPGRGLESQPTGRTCVQCPDARDPDTARHGTWVDYSFLVGPRFRFRAQQRVKPFVQATAGVDHGSAYSETLPASPFEAPDRRSVIPGGRRWGPGHRVRAQTHLARTPVEERTLFGVPEGRRHRLSLCRGSSCRSEGGNRTSTAPHAVLADDPER